MSVLSAADILARLAERGLQVRLGDDGTPRIAGPSDQVTPVLRETLTRHRARIIAYLAETDEAWRRMRDAIAERAAEQTPAPTQAEAMASWRAGAEGREWLHRDGTVMDGSGDWPPQAVYWWRRHGGPWVPVEGRTPHCSQVRPGEPYSLVECETTRCPGCREAGHAVVG